MNQIAAVNAPQPSPADKAEALRLLEAAPLDIAGDKAFEARQMRPEDAWSVARLVYAIYGGDYHFDFYYLPELFAAKLLQGDVLASVASTPSGEIVGYGAIFRSSAPCDKVFEIGQYLVAPPYRGSLAIVRIQSCLLDTLLPATDIDMLFGEAICSHRMTQKLGSLARFQETGLELSLMPATLYKQNGRPRRSKFKSAPGNQEKTAAQDPVRASALIYFRPQRDARRPLYAPDCYAAEIEWILADMGLERELLVSQPSPVSRLDQATTRMEQTFFDQVAVLRCNISAVGRDLLDRLDRLDRVAGERDIATTQMFISLDSPGAATAVQALRERGYFFGGLLPRWFDADGLLMQKIATPLRLDRIELYSPRGRTIFDFVANDLARVDPEAAVKFRNTR